MFDKLIDVLVDAVKSVSFFTVIDSYEEGVIMRLGNCRKVVTSTNGVFGTGFHWMWPLAEKDLTEAVMPRVISYKGRSIMTKDGKNIVFGVTMTYRVKDIRAALLDVHDMHGCLDDIAQLVATRTIQQFNYVDLTTELFDKELLSNARDRAEPYGVYIVDIGLSEVALARTIRLVEGT